MMEWKLDLLPRFDRLLEEMLRGQNTSFKFRRKKGFLLGTDKEPYRNQCRNIASELEEFGKAFEEYKLHALPRAENEPPVRMLKDIEEDMVDALADTRQFIYEGLLGLGVLHNDEQLCFRDTFFTLNSMAQLGLLDDIAESHASKFKVENTLHMSATWINQLLHYMEGDLSDESVINACRDTWLRILLAVYILHCQLRGRELGANEDFHRMCDSLDSRFITTLEERMASAEFWESAGVTVRFEGEYPRMVCYSNGDFTHLDAPKDKFLKPPHYKKPVYTALLLYVSLQ